jgi:hypothetical protein
MMKKGIYRTALVALGAMITMGVSAPAFAHAGTGVKEIPATTATVDYVKGYGIGLIQNGHFDKKVPTGSRWRTHQTSKMNGHVYYDLGGGQLGDSRYLTISGENSTQVYKGVFHLSYSAAVFSSAAGKYAGRSLKANSNWKVFKQTLVNGKAYLNIGGNNWVKKANGYLKSDGGRGNKTFGQAAASKVSPSSSTNPTADNFQQVVPTSSSAKYKPNFTNIKKDVIASMKLDSRGIKIGSIPDNLWTSVGTRSVSAKGYYTSDKSVATALYKQMIASGLGTDLSWKPATIAFSGTASGAITGKKGAINVKMTLNEYFTN